MEESDRTVWERLIWQGRADGKLRLETVNFLGTCSAYLLGNIRLRAFWKVVRFVTFMDYFYYM